MTQLLTFDQAAELCACSVRTLRNAKGLRVSRLGKGAKSDRIHQKDLDAFIDSRRGLTAERMKDGAIQGKTVSPAINRNLRVLLGVKPKKH